MPKKLKGDGFRVEAWRNTGRLTMNPEPLTVKIHLGQQRSGKSLRSWPRNFLGTGATAKEAMSFARNIVQLGA